ncbi:hypothetical protein [Pseudoduganella umbonata]|uniref:Uncharacterized protein n=1 Tax=Pseudoduganella umbonata TaxID=864828 RepID=A0A4P8HHM9_9BURK|nr:hypothetical protein [Pseudoduganella umbonata]MBB3221699.1 hypothetical protein [Pseudoduganella umbonata]QCP09079.1 hypothetical protein FCL38_00480 [Pseudoduganella umbonata]
MRRLTSYAEQMVAAAHALQLTADQQLTVLGMAARIVSQRKEYRAQHASPVARGRRRMNEGYDRGTGYVRESVDSLEPSIASGPVNAGSTS